MACYSATDRTDQNTANSDCDAGLQMVVIIFQRVDILEILLFLKARVKKEKLYIVCVCDVRQLGQCRSEVLGGYLTVSVNSPPSFPVFNSGNCSHTFSPGTTVSSYVIFAKFCTE